MEKFNEIDLTAEDSVRREMGMGRATPQALNCSHTSKVWAHTESYLPSWQGPFGSLSALLEGGHEQTRREGP